MLAPTWDIEVEGTGNFVSEGFIVHNSRLTMKYPSVYLMGPKASGEVLSVAYAGAGQIQDTGAKMIHCAPETTSTIISKSISKDGGSTTYRGKVHVDPGATRSKSYVRCDALILDEESTSETKPYMEVGERDAEIGHEATVSKVGDDQLFYLMSRGLSESQATGMIVNGFIEPVTRTLPMEYAVEWSRLIELQMEGSVGWPGFRHGRRPATTDRNHPGGPALVPMREDCKHFQSRTYPSGEVARFCVLDLAPEAPWRCPDDCPGYERRLADVTWTHGSLVVPPTEAEPDEPAAGVCRATRFSRANCWRSRRRGAQGSRSGGDSGRAPGGVADPQGGTSVHSASGAHRRTQGSDALSDHPFTPAAARAIERPDWMSRRGLRRCGAFRWYADADGG